MVFTSKDVNGFDYVQHYVGSAKHSAQYYASLFGFEIKGYLGPETGVRDRVSYLLAQNDLIFTLTSAITPKHEIWDYLNLHGDGVKEISVRVKDPKDAFDYALNKGAKMYEEPQIFSDCHGQFEKASVRIYGDTVLTYVNRRDYSWFLPGYEPYKGPQFVKDTTGLTRVDHIVGNVFEGQMDQWARFFEDALDLETFIHFDKGDISTKYSSLVSKVVRSKNGTVRFPINEPSEGIKKSQIEEFLEQFHGAGVQHIALETQDIIATIAALKKNGVNFIETPDTYYDVVSERMKGIDEDVNQLKALDILIDREGEGYLLQLFTQPVGDRPTLFYEIIQRKGSEGFGQNNFQSLFESIEQEQAKRGNL